MRPSFIGKHAEFLADQTPQIELEGARYSGKTYVAEAKVILSCLEHPGIRWMICRYSGTETDESLRPHFEEMMVLFGIEWEWDEESKSYLFPEVDGKRSKVQARGLKAQTTVQELEKVRGLNVAGIWLEQAEECKQRVVEELPFGTRQPGYPHQVILTPNPVQDDHFLAIRFPENNSISTRRHYSVSLYDNPHCPPDKLKELENDYPPTHARYRSLVLGKRGPNVVGTPIYERAFNREKHLVPVSYNEERRVLEAIQHGEHHPCYVAIQRNYHGGLHVLGAIMGFFLFLDEFLPVVKEHRQKWFRNGIFETCTDGPPDGMMRHTNIETIDAAGFRTVWKHNSSAPDVREHMIQDIVKVMRKDGNEGFRFNADPSMFLVAQREPDNGGKISCVQNKFFLDGCESNYVWDENRVSVGSKKIRQPKANEWIGSSQRCMENIWLNFFGEKLSDYEKDRKKNLSPTRAAKPRRSRWG